MFLPDGRDHRPATISERLQPDARDQQAHDPRDGRDLSGGLRPLRAGRGRPDLTDRHLLPLSDGADGRAHDRPRGPAHGRAVHGGCDVARGVGGGRG